MTNYAWQPPDIATNGIYERADTFTVSAPLRKFERQGRRAAMRALQQGKPMLYAIRTPSGVIKIGCTTDLYVRKAKIPGELLAFQFGDFAEESAIHESLSDHVHHGREWYYPTAAVMDVVNQMRESFGLEPLATPDTSGTPIAQVPPLAAITQFSDTRAPR